MLRGQVSRATTLRRPGIIFSRRPRQFESGKLGQRLSHSSTSRPLVSILPTYNARRQLATPPSDPKQAINATHRDEVPPMNLRVILRDLTGPYYWIVIGGIALLATAETTFYVKVIHYKFFATEEDEFMEKYLTFWKGVPTRLVPNYRTYWGANLWGL